MQTHISDAISDVDTLEDLLSEPREATVTAMAQLQGDILVLGVGGKMGPTLARMARHASDIAGISRRVIGTARFSSPGLREKLESWGVETLAYDLLDPNSYALLPDAGNVVYMAGMKFGSTGQEPLTWAMNSYLPAPVCQRYPGSRMAIFSTGNVYGFTPVGRGGLRKAIRFIQSANTPRAAWGASVSSNTSARQIGSRWLFCASITQLSFAMVF